MVFIKHADNPLIDIGAGGTWDYERIITGSVIYRNNKWYIYYSGWNHVNYRIGLATSDDGISWTKHPNNPILDVGGVGTWDDVRVNYISVIYRNNKWYMYYTGFDGSIYKIGLATSDDGISWTKHPNNPILDKGAGGTWDDVRVLQPMVIYRNNKWYMYYTGYDGSVLRIGLATSDDGISWTKHPNNPILDVGGVGTWDDVRVNYTSIIYRNNKWYMYYGGYEGTIHRIGLATSDDGISWTKHPNNPILDKGAGGTWDDVHVYYTAVIYRNNKWYMYYSAYDGANMRIGLATSPTGV